MNFDLNKKYAINISAAEMATIHELPESWRIISINEEDGDLCPINVQNPILRLRFSDVGGDCEVKGVKVHTINQKQTHEILDFIKGYEDETYLIHCLAGISRSGAVALFLHNTFRHILKDNYYLLSYANCTVLGLLVREYYHKLNKPKD